MLKSSVAKLAAAAVTIASAVAATSLGATAASAASAHTATTASARPSRALAVACISPWYSIKGAGVNGRDGFFLTDEGHNRLVETTGTGTQWCSIDKSVHNGHPYYELESRSSGLCLNVAGISVYMDSCVNADANEHFTGVRDVYGYVVLQNYATHLNMTVDGLFNGSFVYVAGGPANFENQWIVTILE